MSTSPSMVTDRAWRTALENLDKALNKGNGNDYGPNGKYRPSAILLAIELLETTGNYGGPVSLDKIIAGFPSKKLDKNKAYQPFWANSNNQAKFWTLRDPLSKQPPTDRENMRKNPATEATFLEALQSGLGNGQIRKDIKKCLNSMLGQSSRPTPKPDKGKNNKQAKTKSLAHVTLDANEAAVTEQDLGFFPSDKDERALSFRQIRARRGQKTFRDKLLKLHKYTCMVTGCKIADILEAAHIAPAINNNNNDVSNGLLLRTDIHTLFDLNLLGIEPETLRIVINSDIKDEYQDHIHKFLETQPSKKPSNEALQERYKHFCSRNSVT